jgi:Anti-sigma factor NepR
VDPVPVLSGIGLPHLAAARAGAQRALPDPAREARADGDQRTFVVGVEDKAGHVVLRAAFTAMIDESPPTSAAGITRTAGVLQRGCHGRRRPPDDIAPLEMDLPDDCEFGPARGRLGPFELDWIGRELREYYDDLLREPVPDRLLALIDRSLAWRILH